MLQNAIRKVIAFVALLSCVTVLGQQQAPLQADASVRVNKHATIPLSTQLAGGPATLTGAVWKLPGDQTALVALKFDYLTNADIALDEIISKIVVTTEDLHGNTFSIVKVNPNTIYLNPNRVPLYYSATLYTPEQRPRSNEYIVRVRVFGNYE